MTLPASIEVDDAVEPEYLRLDDGCTLLSISMRSLYRLRDDKFLSFYRVKGLKRDTWRVKRSELLALMEEERRS